MLDLLIEGGTVVDRHGRRPANVAVRDGTIVAVGAIDEAAHERVDAGGLLVLPGMVDSHVHLMDPADPTREDFPTGTTAAATAGVTTIVEHSHGQPVLTADDLHAKRDYLTGRARIDFALAAHAMPDTVAQVPALWRDGAAYIKAFTCTTHGITGFDPGALRELLVTAAAADAVCLIHCEEDSLTRAAETRLKAEQRDDGAIVPEWRSREAELASIASTALLARTTGARIVIAHVSNTEALERIAWERRHGADVTAESCPQYLQLYESEAGQHGALRKFTPPARARTRRELDRMWAALSDGDISIVSSDHAPSTMAQKCSGSIWDVHFGLPGLDTTFPVLMSAAHDGVIAYERIVEAYAWQPARTYGLRGKGQLAAGFDADVILVDPDATRTLRNGDIKSRAGWTPYDGMSVTGQVQRTYSRGNPVADQGRPVGDGTSGRFVRARNPDRETAETS